jgi:peptidoglycan/LPS O-acetylase OafA/YrhL
VTSAALPPAHRAPRLTSLDGLRGIAAVVVLIYHGTQLIRPALDGGAASGFKVISETPLKLSFAGTESVLVFFALSGLVVALPALRESFSWPGYYVTRLIRLYLPVWGALAMASVFILLIPRSADGFTAGSWLLDGSARSIQWPRLLAEASLTPASYNIDNVLWSLRWEVLFSITLPLFVGLALLIRRWAVPALAAAVVLGVIGRVVDLDALVYLPVFFAGTLLAVRLDDLRTWSARQSKRFWIAFALVAAALLIASWLGRPFAAPDSVGDRALWGLAGAGAIGMVVLAVGSPVAARVLSTRPVGWLGTISFSLYLVHVPVLATLSYALGEANWPLVLAIGIPVSLLLARCFHEAVERPSHHLARAAGRLVSRAAERRVAVAEPTGR